MNYKFVVQGVDVGKRLDAFLSLQAEVGSRSYVQKLIKGGMVKVGSRQISRNSYKVREEDHIYVNTSHVRQRMKVVVPVQMQIDVIYQDTDILVVNKACGISVHPGVGNWNNTLVNGLLYRFRAFQHVGEPYKWGLIHRLDKDTSGALMVALNSKALWYFSRQFEKREVQKTYLAIVQGDIRILCKDSGQLVISNYIGRHSKNRKRMALVSARKGRFAVTQVCFLAAKQHKVMGKLSLVIARPRTGRTHQIRLHLASQGFPIIGDKVYGRNCAEVKKGGDKEHSRLMLHAYQINIRMLNGEMKLFEAPIPQEFDSFFDMSQVLKRKIQRNYK